MQTIAIILVIMALVVGIVPQFTDCLSRGSAISLPSGATIPMKCHWSRQAEIALALPLAATGAIMVFTRRRGTLRALAVVALVLGAGIVLVPTSLIGVCGNPEMICNMLMRPVLIFCGILTMSASAIGLVYLRGDDPDVLHAEVGPQTP